MYKDAKSIKIIPNQKLGMERPPKAKSLTEESDKLFRLTAETIPKGTPTQIATKSDAMVSCNVTGKLVLISASTVRPVEKDLPRSPLTTFQSHITYRVWIGLSNMKWAFISAICSGDPDSGPKRMSTASPGIKEMTKNDKTETPMSTGKRYNRRLKMYFSIGVIRIRFSKRTN